MKKILLIFALILNSFPTYAKQEQLVDEIRIQVKKFEDECYNKSFPVNNPEKMDHLMSFYNDEMKNADRKYHNCLKEIIIEKIKQDSSVEDAKKMIESLDKIEQGILAFYETMFYQTDTGTIGKDFNDAVLGRRYEDILYDVLKYQYVYGKDSEFTKMLIP